MLEGLRTVVYHVGDLERAKSWYGEVLGAAPYFDQPFYVGFSVGGYELGLLPDALNEGDKAKGVVTYWGVPDVDAAYARLLSLGATENVPVEDVGDGIRLGSVVDPFGNALGVIHNPNFRLP